MKKVYVLLAVNNGDYEDKNEWIVAIYTSKRSADAHAKLAGEFEDSVPMDGWRAGPSPYDPQAEHEIRPCRYGVYAHELRSHAPRKRARPKNRKDAIR